MHGDLRSRFFRVAVDARGDAGEGDGFAAVLRREGERVAVAGRQLIRFAVLTVAINRPHGVDHELRGQLESRRDPRFARRTPHARTHLRYLETRLKEFFARRVMDCTIHATTAQHHLVRRVDNGVHRQRRYIAFYDFYHLPHSFHFKNAITRLILTTLGRTDNRP